MLENTVDKELSFERVEGKGEPGAESLCSLCGAAIRHAYYQLAGTVVCAACRGRELAEREAGGPVARFARAAAFGAGAAILGALLWYGIAELTGREFGLIAIVIGLFVGGAVRMGSRRRGGWLYQGLAMLLTYTSIVSTYIPQIISAAGEYEATGDAVAPGDEPASTATAEEVSAYAAAEPETKPEEEGVMPAPAAAVVPAPLGALGLVLGLFLLLGLAFIAPFLGGFENFMGWIILAIGLYEAWKLNRREEMVFEGPFRLSGAPSMYIPETPPPPIEP